MPTNLPLPFAPLYPLETVAAEIDLELVLALDTNGGIDVVCSARQIDPSKRIWQPLAVVREEERSRGEVVATPDHVARLDARQVGRVVSAAQGILKVFAEIVEV